MQEGYNIILSQAPINDPEADFRKLVEGLVENGELDFIARERLNIKQINLGISEEKAEQIIDEVLAPHRQYLENRKHYQQIYQKIVESEYPLSQRLRDKLKGLQDDLGLKDEDITQIHGEIVPQDSTTPSPQSTQLKQTTGRMPVPQIQLKLL